MFALPQLTAAHVRTFNLRTEKHGGDNVTAMDLGMRVTGPSSLLDMIHPGLRGVFYLPPEPSQASIPGESAPWTVLRCEAVHTVPVKHELVGRNVILLPTDEIESELREDDQLAMGSCNVNKFSVTAYAGGTVDIDFRIQTNDIDSHAIGMGGAMLSQDVKLSVTHTEVPEEPAASTAEPPRVEKDATTLFAENEAAGLNKPAEPERGPAWPFPGDVSPGSPAAELNGTPPAHLTEPKVSKAQRKRDDAAKAH